MSARDFTAHPTLTVGSGGAQPARRLENLRDLAKFTGLVALFAIFVDAAVGHGLLWENDPYWTYWITKTALIATVFGLGTAWLGIGAARGAVITAVHTVVLTVYYWSLSPIGLPSHPEWLDLEHTWGTGVPVHFGVIYLGYLGSLWLWRRRERLRTETSSEDSSSVARDAGKALAIALAIVVVGGGAASAATGKFPGVTWYLVRLLITVPFVLGWWAFAGRDRAAAVGGAIVLAFVWATYGHFLGPSGLPDLPLRITDQAPPGATVEWLGYRELWLVGLPITLAAALLVLVPTARSRSGEDRGRRYALGLTGVGVIGAVVVAALIGLALETLEPGGDRAALAASGTARIEQGSWFSNDYAYGLATLRLSAQERSLRVSPLPPHDLLRIDAAVSHPDGTTYDIEVKRPMVEDPRGEHGTWWGVGLHRWHHGRSGIGSPKLPAINSEVAAFGLGQIQADGRVVATGVPVHVMTAEKGLPGRLELEVGADEPGGEVPALPDGHLRVVWEDYSGGASQVPRRTRNVLGTGTLVTLLALAGLAVKREEASA
jgi:hypothetical protein